MDTLLADEDSCAGVVGTTAAALVLVASTTEEDEAEEVLALLVKVAEPDVAEDTASEHKVPR